MALGEVSFVEGMGELSSMPKRSRRRRSLLLRALRALQSLRFTPATGFAIDVLGIERENVEIGLLGEDIGDYAPLEGERVKVVKGLLVFWRS